MWQNESNRACLVAWTAPGPHLACNLQVVWLLGRGTQPGLGDAKRPVEPGWGETADSSFAGRPGSWRAARLHPHVQPAGDRVTAACLEHFSPPHFFQPKEKLGFGAHLPPWALSASQSSLRPSPGVRVGSLRPSPGVRVGSLRRRSWAPVPSVATSSSPSGAAARLPPSLAARLPPLWLLVSLHRRQLISLRRHQPITLRRGCSSPFAAGCSSSSQPLVFSSLCQDLR
jgi:hypothetical protein